MNNFVKNSYLVQLGTRIREIRKAKKLSMESLAAEVDIDYRQLGRIERGEINTSILSLKRIADVLQISMCEIFDLKKD